MSTFYGKSTHMHKNVQECNVCLMCWKNFKRQYPNLYNLRYHSFQLWYKKDTNFPLTEKKQKQKTLLQSKHVYWIPNLIPNTCKLAMKKNKQIWCSTFVIEYIIIVY